MKHVQHVRMTSLTSIRCKKYNFILYFKWLNTDLSLTSFSWIHCQIWTYSTPYSSVYNFEQVNICLKPVSRQYIYTRLEQDYHSAIAIVNFEHITPCSSVFTINFEHVFIFLVWFFNILLVFRLRWMDIKFIYRKDFLEVKYLHEVACISPCLFIYLFFSKFIQNF